MVDEVDIGHGSRVELGVEDGMGAVTWTEVTPLYDFQPPAPTYDEIDTTHFGSPNRTKEFKPSLKDNGESSLTFAYMPGSALDLAMTASEGKTRQLRFTLNGADPEVYAVFLKQHQRNIPMDDKMVSVASFRVSAKIEAV